MPAAGSSSSSSSGSAQSARAISTRFWWPYDSRPAGAPRSRSRPRNAAISRARSRCRRSSRRALGSRSPVLTNPALVRWCRPSSRFSSTVSPRDSAMFWNVRATPSPATSCGRSRVRSVPRKRTAPAAGLYAPETTLNIVDLPAPFGPMTAWIAAGATSNETPSSATTPANRTVTPSTERAAVTGSTGAAPDGRRRPRTVPGRPRPRCRGRGTGRAPNRRPRVRRPGRTASPARS